MINSINPATSFGTGTDASAIQSRREQMFANMDTNGDGTISKAEFLAAFQQNGSSGTAAAGASTLTPDQLFAKLDTNGDGTISKSEFMAAHHKHGGKMKAQQNPADLFAQIDTNGDGTISKSEFEAFLQKLQAQDQAQANGTSPSPTDSVQLSSLSVADSLNQLSSQDSSSSTTTYQPTGLIPQLAPESTLNVVG